MSLQAPPYPNYSLPFWPQGLCVAMSLITLLPSATQLTFEAGPQPPPGWTRALLGSRSALRFQLYCPDHSGFVLSSRRAWMGAVLVGAETKDVSPTNCRIPGFAQRYTPQGEEAEGISA